MKERERVKGIELVRATLETTGIIELDPEVTKVERMLDVVRQRAYARCEPGLMQMLRDKGFSDDKLEEKMDAYGVVLGLMRSGALREADLHAIRHDWSDAMSSTGGWQRG